MSYNYGMQVSSAGLYGEGKVVYSTKKKPNPTLADNPALKKLQAEYQEVQAKRRAEQAAQKAAHQANKKGNVTVYDAAKKQYVSASADESKIIREGNKEIQAQRRAAQKAAKEAGKVGNVTVFDVSKGLHVSATPQEAKEIVAANKKIEAIKGLDERITSHMGNNPSYGGKTVKSGNKFISVSADQVEAQVQRRAAQKAAKEAGKVGNVTVFDASKGLYISATPQDAKKIATANRAAAVEALNERITSHMGNNPNYGGKTVKSGNKFISVSADQVEAQAQRRAAQAAEKAAKEASKHGNVTVFDASKGLHVSATPQEAREIAAANQGITAVENTANKKGFWASLKNSLSNLGSKINNFIKTPKGKWSLAIAAIVAVGTGLWAYVSDRFSDKNKPTPTNGPDKVYMPKLNEDKETESTKKVKKETKKNDNSPKVTPTPVPAEKSEETEKTEKTEEKEEKEETKETDKTDETKAAPVSTDESKETEEKEEKDKAETNEYTVVKGDNLWNIAKRNLKEQHKDDENYIPSDKEILQKTEELMKLNNKHYEEPLPSDSRKRVVIIEPDEKIKLK